MRAAILALILTTVSAAASAETAVARLDTVGCYYHDVLWDKAGYDQEGRPTPELLGLDICTGITAGQKLEVYEHQIYAPSGLKIVRIDGKLYFIRLRDLDRPEAVKKSGVRKPGAAKTVTQAKKAAVARTAAATKQAGKASKPVSVK